MRRSLPPSSTRAPARHDEASATRGCSAGTTSASPSRGDTGVRTASTPGRGSASGHGGRSCGTVPIPMLRATHSVTAPLQLLARATTAARTGARVVAHTAQNPPPVASESLGFADWPHPSSSWPRGAGDDGTATASGVDREGSTAGTGALSGGGYGTSGASARRYSGWRG
jgi:hypothetical protein